MYNLTFAIFYGLCAYFYTLAMLEDPGYVPKLGSRIQQKAVIDELISLWNFDDQHFCVTCMIRQPLRSKHCRRCGRCVAKHDHHCPWIHNCVGANNHRHFILYVINLFLGATVFVRLVLYHIFESPSPLTDISCNVLPNEVCQYTLRDPMTVVIGLWTALQVVWVTMLLVVQFVQITRAQTTYESMRGNIHSGSQASEAITSALTAGTTSMDGAQISGTGMGPDPAVPGSHSHKHKEGYFASMEKDPRTGRFYDDSARRHYAEEKGESILQRRDYELQGLLVRSVSIFWEEGDWRCYVRWRCNKLCEDVRHAV